MTTEEPEDPAGPGGLGEAAAAAEMLAREVRKLRWEIRRKTRLGYLVAGVVSVAALAAIVWGAVNQVRIDGTVGKISTSQRESAVQQEQLRRGQDASCTAFARIGDAPLSPTASPFARGIVADFGAAADIIGCARPPLPAPTVPPVAPSPSGGG